MKLGAIDIGSNAIRLLISEVSQIDKKDTIEKLTLVRIPLRLGDGVFTSGKISPLKAERLAKSIQAFRLLLEVYGVEHYRACATSAMREASNGEEVRNQIKKFAGVDLEVIAGNEEAALIHSTFHTLDIDLSKDYLYIDVGGGSTEVSLLKKGKPVLSKSFNIGTVRILKGKDTPEAWAEMIEFSRELGTKGKKLQAIGSGGNINKYVKLGPLNHIKALKVGQLEDLYEDLSALGIASRMKAYDLKADRADVIVPAGKIYMEVLRAAGIKQINVPKLGLSDGIVYDLYKKHFKN